ncbi:hypothetical protein YA43_04530 [Enterobacter hormaechei subsp. steigerwaltii]|uniref:hypothetical protein n=1 Tax=Enterobacter hormaechei TaxID=158836 RepID=UPI00063CD0C9|nr:hypothetical protein YA43_04530 [Enterobacter hormaechei subsp. steigerwaltii]MBE4901214.1 hypothetical protein [Enterobacter cloacae complex sp. P8RS]MCE1960022.1 hypothetical protein [Enterobacter hormaechei]VAK68643.1 Uncharacterised protein [Enterobacter hormaechei]HCM9323851.1 hypothetical protein [Enterobacter hormaechei subsp. steigerwaltii]
MKKLNLIVSMMLNDKLWSLLFTVLPGVNRVLLFFIVSHVVTTHTFALFSSVYSIAVIISMIGGVGVGTVILKNNTEFGMLGFLKATIIGFVTSICSAIIILFFFKDVLSSSWLGLIILSVGLIMNQILRYMIIVNKSFKIGTFNELVLMLPSLIFLVMSQIDLISILGIMYIIQSLLVVLICFKDSSNPKLNYFKGAFYIGNSNLISSGILYFLPMIAFSLSGAEITSIISLMVTAAGIITVFPRAMLNLKVKELHLILLNNKEQYYDQSRCFKKQIIYIMLLGFIAMMGYVYLAAKNASTIEIMIVGLCIFSFISVGQYSIIESTLINLVGKEKLSLLLNAITFTIFIIMYYIMHKFISFPPLIAIVILSGTVLIAYYIRYFVMKKVLAEV